MSKPKYDYEFEKQFAEMLSVKPVDRDLDKPVIRLYQRGNIGMRFLVSGDIPVGYEASPNQSKNPAHNGLIILNPRPVKKLPEIYKIAP